MDSPVIGDAAGDRRTTEGYTPAVITITAGATDHPTGIIGDATRDRSTILEMNTMSASIGTGCGTAMNGAAVGDAIIDCRIIQKDTEATLIASALNKPARIVGNAAADTGSTIKKNAIASGT